jgi:hypothetical protein
MTLFLMVKPHLPAPWNPPALLYAQGWRGGLLQLLLLWLYPLLQYVLLRPQSVVGFALVACSSARFRLGVWWSWLYALRLPLRVFKDVKKWRKVG